MKPEDAAVISRRNFREVECLKNSIRLVSTVALRRAGSICAKLDCQNIDSVREGLLSQDTSILEKLQESDAHTIWKLCSLLLLLLCSINLSFPLAGDEIELECPYIKNGFHTFTELKIHRSNGLLPGLAWYHWAEAAMNSKQSSCFTLMNTGVIGVCWLAGTLPSSEVTPLFVVLCLSWSNVITGSCCCEDMFWHTCYMCVHVIPLTLWVTS